MQQRGEEGALKLQLTSLHSFAIERATAMLLRMAHRGMHFLHARSSVRELPLHRTFVLGLRGVHDEPRLVKVAPPVRRALEEGRPVVALESTIISHGMPYPENLAMARGVEDIVRQRGAVPATVAILKGQPHVGLSESQLESLAEAGPRARKCSRRDLAVAIAQGADGATTVAGTAFLASLVGVKVFVTGGMGGVHRGAETTFDVSADLAELSQTPIVVVCAGVKSILDIDKTLEVLETNGVPVISYGTNNFPAFFSPSSGVPSPLRLDSPSEVALTAKAGFDLGMKNGLIVAVPNPSPMSGGAEIDAAIRAALEEAEAKGVKGRDVTPFVLAEVNENTGGQSLKSNVALIRHNAKVGAEIAVQLAAVTGHPSPSQRTQPGARSGGASMTPAPEWRQHSSPSPHVVIFGGAVADIVSKSPNGTPLTPGTSTPGITRQSFGGVGRNVAEGVSRVLAGWLGGTDEAGESRRGTDSSGGADVTLVSVVGGDDAGKALVAGCEEVGVKAAATVEVGSNGRGQAGTASYVAVLGGDGDLVAAVADMRVFENMTPEFVERHASVVDGAAVVVADGNLPPNGLHEVARLCARRRVPLVFEPTSVAKCSVPFSTRAVGGIALTSPNLDELAAMSAAAEGDGATRRHGGALREGHSLAKAALSDGKLANPRPLGAALKTVLAAMLDDEAEAPMALLDGGRHVVVTLGSAGVLLASARPSQSLRGGDTGHGDRTSSVESPAGSGRWFTLSAEHYPALPLERQGQEGDRSGEVSIVDCTGAGDCLVAGMIGGFALGWRARESVYLGLLCARQSVMADEAVPRSLSDILTAQAYSGSSWHVRAMLPDAYGPKIVNPWAAAE